MEHSRFHHIHVSFFPTLLRCTQQLSSDLQRNNLSGTLPEWKVMRALTTANLGVEDKAVYLSLRSLTLARASRDGTHLRDHEHRVFFKNLNVPKALVLLNMAFFNMKKDGSTLLMYSLIGHP